MPRPHGKSQFGGVSACAVWMWQWLTLCTYISAIYSCKRVSYPTPEVVKIIPSSPLAPHLPFRPHGTREFTLSAPHLSEVPSTILARFRTTFSSLIYWKASCPSRSRGCASIKFIPDIHDKIHNTCKMAPPSDDERRGWPSITENTRSSGWKSRTQLVRKC